MIHVIFFGTSEFAVPALKKLAADSNYQIAAVVTQPDKPAGRKQELSPSPVKIVAQELGLNILQLENLLAFDKLRQYSADLFIVASYGKIIPKAVLDIPKYGPLNIHPSLLPKYRGPSPIQAAILNGDIETGVTIMKLDKEMDHGNIVANVKIQISNDKIKYQELHDELAERGAELLFESLPKYISGEIKPVPQEHDKATYTKIISKDDGRIDWSKSAEEIDRQVRAYEAWPVAWTTLEGKRLKIFDSTPLPVIPATEQESRKWIPGQARDDKKTGDLVIQCGSGLLKINSLQLEGAKKITAREFANGHKDLENIVLK